MKFRFVIFKKILITTWVANPLSLADLVELESLHSAGDEEGGADHHVSEFLQMRTEVFFLSQIFPYIIQRLDSQSAPAACRRRRGGW